MSRVMRWVLFLVGFALLGRGLHTLQAALDTRPMAFGTATMAVVWIACGLLLAFSNEPPIVDRAFRWIWRRDK